MIPRQFHHFLINAQDLRNTGDYGEFDAVTLEDISQSFPALEHLTKRLGNL
jgi:hypothetical protein